MTVYKVYFVTDGDISVLYDGQDTSKNFGAHIGICQKPKNLEVCYIKNLVIIKHDFMDFSTCRCDLCIPSKYGSHFIKFSTKNDNIIRAIKYFSENSK